MATIDDITPNAENAFALIGRLSPEEQAKLLAQLGVTEKKTPLRDGERAAVVHLPESTVPMSLEELAGSWEDNRSAEEIVEDLRRSRTPNRDRVNL